MSEKEDKPVQPQPTKPAAESGGEKPVPQPPTQAPQPAVQRPPTTPPIQAKPTPATAVRPPTPPTPPRYAPKAAPHPQKLARRTLLKLLTLLGGITTITPFVPFGEFAYSAIGAKGDKQKIMLPSGIAANVKTFPVNSSAIIVYPRTGDVRLDSEPFRRYQLIRLPKELSGDKNDASSFRAYSMICVHLWCLWNYRPLVVDERTGKRERGTGECPCHGSVYDILTGKAVLGPAALQAPPSNALSSLSLEVDSAGDVYALPLDSSLNKNGVVGFGRYVE